MFWCLKLFVILKPDSSDTYMSDDKRTSSFEGFLITSTLFFLFCNKLLKLRKGLYIFRKEHENSEAEL